MAGGKEFVHFHCRLCFAVENRIPASAGGVGILPSVLVETARGDVPVLHNMEMLIHFAPPPPAIANSDGDHPSIPCAPTDHSSLGSTEPYRAFHLTVLN